MSLPPDIPPDPDEAARRRAADPLFASVARAADVAGVGECLDVETLALYADRALKGAALVSAQRHLERCERCRATVAVIERADAEADAAARGEGFRGWFTGWRWLMPAASVAAVAMVAVWLNRGPSGDVAPPASPESAMASGERDRVPAPGAAPAPAVVPGAADVQQHLARPSNESRDAIAGLAGSAAPTVTSTADGLERKRADVMPPAAQAQASVPAPAAPARMPTGTAPTASDAREAAVAEAVEGRALADLRMAAPSAAGARAGAGAIAEPMAPATRNEIVAAKSADAVAPLWRVRDGGVERLRAGDWQRVAIPDGVTVVAIASPSRDVCWAIGAADIVRTWNGETWTRVVPPETSEPLRAVSATDASTAVVTTASGVRFGTANGGATWSRL